MLKIAELSGAKEALKEKAVRALNEAGVSQENSGDESGRVFSFGSTSVVCLFLLSMLLPGGLVLSLLLPAYHTAKHTFHQAISIAI